ncbi:hypothetical protein QA644_10725 [Rhizobium sp. CC1099]|uniref:hypothetical protein n=1 Tax=Rhizobium sp. CC1099 TaxID=3039160 RepID=UPI0024B24944|nr:hypothetical protein [Rhizobium sp. CC1099]WFU89469.1 hypothetical protein QA644_10725 [Rhizobium sp. CC1099]
MARKPRQPISNQEALVATFAKHSISSRSTFHPDQWSSGKEPADMLIIVGRALLFFNMKDSKAYLKDLYEANLKQARDRIDEWRGGRQLRGKNDWRSFIIHWTDIDYIHVISVVDGRYAGCLGHDVEQLDMDEKVRLCTTVTSKVLRELAKHGGGARDLIAICQQIEAKGQISENATVRLVRKRYNALLYEAMESVTIQPSRLGRAIIGGREVSAFDEYRFTFEATRSQSGEGLEVFSDLAWSDIFPAIAFIVSSTAEMEWLEEGQARSACFGENTKFRVVISSNMQGLNLRLQEIIDMSRLEGSTFTYLISLTNIGPMGTFAVSGPPEKWSTELDLGR